MGVQPIERVLVADAAPQLASRNARRVSTGAVPPLVEESPQPWRVAEDQDACVDEAHPDVRRGQHVGRGVLPPKFLHV